MDREGIGNLILAFVVTGLLVTLMLIGIVTFGRSGDLFSSRTELETSRTPQGVTEATR